MSERPAVPTPEDFRFSYPIEVRFRDLDAMGHVNNAVYFTYFEIARTRYMEALGYAREGVHTTMLEFPFILGEVSCRYLAPALLNQTVVVHLRALTVGGKTFDFEYLITEKHSGQALAIGNSVQVFYDYESGKSKPLTDDFKGRLQKLEGREF